MSAAALLREAAAAGVTVRLVDGRPKVIGNPEPALLARLREHKAEIVAILLAAPDAPACMPEQVEPVPVLFAEIRKLSRRHPDGVDESLLKSNFILEMHTRRQAAGIPKPAAAEYTAEFAEVLVEAIAEEFVTRLDGGRYATGPGRPSTRRQDY